MMRRRISFGSSFCIMKSVIAGHPMPVFHHFRFALLSAVLFVFLRGVAFTQMTGVGVVDSLDVSALQWSPSGTSLATGHGGGVTLWDGASGRVIRRIPLQSSWFPDFPPLIRSIAWSTDDTRLAVRLNSRDTSVVQIIDVATGVVLIDDIDGGQKFGIDWNPDSTRIAVPYSPFLNGREEVRVFDATDGEMLYALSIPLGGSIGKVMWSPDGAYLAASFITNEQSGVIFWDGSTGSELRHLSQEEVISDFDWNAVDDRLVTIDTGNMLKIWSASTGTHLQTIVPPFQTNGEVAWHPSGNGFALKPSGPNAHRGIVVINAINGAVRFEVPGPSDFLDWKTDGKIIATIFGAAPLFVTHDGDVLPQLPIPLVIGVTDSVSAAPIALMYEGQFSHLPMSDITDLHIQAYPNRASVGSMVFHLNGVQSIDNESPFTLSYPPSGDYMLSVTAYSEPEAQGISGSPLTVHFAIRDPSDPTSIPTN